MSAGILRDTQGVLTTAGKYGRRYIYLGHEGSCDDAAVELGGEVVVLGVLVLLGELGAVVVGGGDGVADVGGAGGAGDGDVEDGLGLVDVRVGDVGVACLLAVVVEDGVLDVEVVALLGEVGCDRALENGVVALERATGRAL